MADELHRGYKIIPETNTGFTAFSGPFVTLPVDLADVVGYVPANFNMMPWGINNQSSNFLDPIWILSNASITTGIMGPTGLLNASKLVENNVNNTHYIDTEGENQLTAITPISKRLAVIAKASTRTRIVLSLTNATDANGTVSVGFDLAGGNTNYDNVVGSSATLISVSMTNLGGGWWLCQFDSQYNATPASTAQSWNPHIYLDNGSGTAARSITYTGDGSSGVLLWWFSFLWTAMWGFTKRAFRDDFDTLNTIDLTNSKAAGFNWYVNNRAPNTSFNTFGWTTNPPSAPTQSSYLTISSPSILKIYNPNAFNAATAGWTSQLWSVVMPDAGGYIGTAFSPAKGMLYDGLFNWDGSLLDSTVFAGTPAFWGATVDVLTGVTSTGRFIEWDVFEGEGDKSGHVSMSKHEWSNSAAPVDAKYGAISRPSFVMSLGTFRRMSGIWLPIDASGWGMLGSFIDGYWQGFEIYYRSSGNPFPTQAGFVSGSFSEAESTFMPIFMNTAETTSGTPGGVPMYVDMVQVYTLP